MAIQVADNFQYLGQKPLDARVKYATVADMAAVAASSLYDGIMAYVVATEKNYQWKSTNTVDQTLGKWREFESGGGSGADNVVEGYRNPTNGLFYEEAAYTTAITGAANTLYVDLVTVGDAKDIYRWDGTEFILENTRSLDIDYDDYQALSESEKNNGTTYYIPDATAANEMLVVGNRFDKANIYTPTERMIGSFLSKPLYQKVIDLSSIIPSTATPVTILTGVDELVDYRVKRENEYLILYDGQADSNCISFKKQSGEVKITPWSSKYSYGNFDWGIFQYTKTTDGTIKIGTENDYSTDEMIIGTWIDGKPVYQKTYSLTNISISANSTIEIIDLSSLSIDNVANMYAVGNENGNLINISCANCSIYINSSKKMICGGSSSWNFNHLYVTIQYTKTTD